MAVDRVLLANQTWISGAFCHHVLKAAGQSLKEHHCGFDSQSTGYLEQFMTMQVRWD